MVKLQRYTDIHSLKAAKKSPQKGKSPNLSAHGEMKLFIDLLKKSISENGADINVRIQSGKK